MNLLADLTIGDAWLPKYNHPDGISTIITRTKLGQKIVSNARKEDYIEIDPIPMNDIILAQKGHNILGIGIITDEYLYNESAPFAHQRIVEWIIKNPKPFLTGCFNF